MAGICERTLLRPPFANCDPIERVEDEISVRHVVAP